MYFDALPFKALCLGVDERLSTNSFNKFFPRDNSSVLEKNWFAVFPITNIESWDLSKSPKKKPDKGSLRQ